MKYVKVCDCLKCENLIDDEIMEGYICKIETNGVNEYVGDTKLPISDNHNWRRCLK